MPSTLSQALVIGNSLSGLLAASVLSKHFGTIRIVEPKWPKGQGQPPAPMHAHLLPPPAAQLLEDLLPGILDDLLAQGGHALDFKDHVAWHACGSWKPPHSGGPLHVHPYALLESCVRARVQMIPNVHLHPGRTVTDLVYDRRRRYVRGLDLAPLTKDQHTVQMSAEMIVDASGLASTIPTHLQSWGYPEVEATHIHTNVQYATRLFRAPDPGTYPWQMMALTRCGPHQTRSGMLLPYGKDQCLITLAGWLGDHPPTDLDGFLEFAKTLPTPDLHQVIASLEPLEEEGTLHHVPYARRLRYDKLKRPPRGLVALGDAVCNFDPVFGPKTTMDAAAVLILRRWLDRGEWRPPRQFYKSLARTHHLPWTLAMADMRRYPQLKTPRSPGLGWIQKYTDFLMRAAPHNDHLYQTLFSTLHLSTSPLALASPKTLFQAVCLSSKKPTPAPVTRQLPEGDMPPTTHPDPPVQAKI